MTKNQDFFKLFMLLVVVVLGLFGGIFWFFVFTFPPACFDLLIEYPVSVILVLIPC